MLCGSCIKPKKQFKVQIIGILEEIDSFYWPKMNLWKGDKTFGQGTPSPLIWTKSKRTTKFFVKSYLSCLYSKGKAIKPTKYAFCRPIYFIFLQRHNIHFIFVWNAGQFRLPVTRPLALPTPLWHTYSEPSGWTWGFTMYHTIYVISELGSRIYIGKSAILIFFCVFWIFWHEITLKWQWKWQNLIFCNNFFKIGHKMILLKAYIEK